MTARDLLELSSLRPLRPRTVPVLLGLLLLWSFALRLWYATPDLNSTRFWDERYGLENLEPLLQDGSLRPVHGFHPSLSYLPHGLLLKASDLLYRASGWQPLAIFEPGGSYTPTAYLICRSLQAVFGTLSLLLVFFLGRRLGGERLGLLAAFFLSIVPWHLRQSVLFKADIVLLLTVVLTVYLSLRAVERPSLSSFAAGGAAIGLALSSKFNAGPAAVPLVAGAFMSGMRKRRALFLLAAAALVSVAVLLLLQPYLLIEPEIYVKSMGSTARVYAREAQKAGHSRPYLFFHAGRSLLSSSFHGPLVGSLALAGLAGVTVLSLKTIETSRGGQIARSWLMVLAYVVSYSVMYVLATPRASAHNWLPLAPFAALAAAWMLLVLWQLIGVTLPGLHRPSVGTAAVLAIILPLAWSANSYTYRNTVPRTGDRALQLLSGQLRRPPGRLVYSEHDFEIGFQKRHRKGRLALGQVSSLESLGVALLDGSDAEVFPASRLLAADARAFYRRRIDRLAVDQVHRFEPAWFKAWGPKLVVLLHPHAVLPNAQTGRWARDIADRRLYRARIPPMPEDRLASLEFFLPRRLRAIEIVVDGEHHELVSMRGPRRRDLLTTPRFSRPRTLSLRVNRPSGPKEFPFFLRQWNESAPDRTDSRRLRRGSSPPGTGERKALPQAATHRVRPQAPPLDQLP